jgi:MYXO-CTERM domain-containing protein
MCEKTVIKFVISSVLALLTASAFGGIAGTQFEFTILDSSAFERVIPANDFHVIFSGTGGGISNTQLNPDPDPGGSGVAVPNGGPGNANGIDVTWTNMVDTNDGFAILFDSQFWPIQVEDAYWTLNGQRILTLGVNDYTLTQVPSPGSMALLGLGGLVAARRRRVCG